MLTANDRNRINEICESNQEFAYFLEKIKTEQHLALSKISHEVRNPVTIINSFLQLYEAKHPDITQDPYWIKINENVSYLRSLLDNLSFYNHSETVHKKMVNPCTLLNCAIESIRPCLEQRPVALHFHQETPVPDIPLDAVKIQQVFYNILRNSAEALTNQKHDTITASIQAKASQVIIEIADNGCGIPSEYLDTLFDPFVTHKEEGNGLGLAICQRIIEAHNGSIQVTSQPGKTVFSICLPFS